MQPRDEKQRRGGQVARSEQVS
ncbi:hypothetical protein E2C01_063686 [Portunus trituberculatus]|uniref:Uncharacterized protein n=1 Tax=Portunus trituberculatus TaxID=210409 RepID=A0A5B7H9T4_PORTR|nr:hypothetical protein [Portunus trituberculatus]